MSKASPKLTRISLLAANIAMIGGLSACAHNSEDRQELVQNIMTADFANTYWKLIELDDKPVTMGQNQEREQHLIFHSQDKTVTGFAGCNRFFGQYQIDRTVSTSNKVATTGNLTLNGLGATKMACPEASRDEQVFLTAVSESTTYTIAGETLTLSDDSENTLAKFNAVQM